MAKFIIVLAILFIGYGALALYFRHDCKKNDIERGEDNG